mgnify:CR=1 FL=1
MEVSLKFNFSHTILVHQQTQLAREIKHDVLLESSGKHHLRRMPDF